MAPSKLSAASQPAPQARKQASISSFFTPKAVRVNPQKTTNGHPDKLYTDGTNADTADDAITRSVSVEQRTFANRSKRTSDTYVSDVENIEPGAKRRKTSVGNIRSLEAENGSPTSPPPRTTTRQHLQSPHDGGGLLPSSTRTSKYMFSKSSESIPLEAPQLDDDEDVEARRFRERMHQKFVKKLVKPDALLEIRRRNSPNTEDGDGEQKEHEAEDDDEEASRASKTAKGKRPGGARANGKLTPMELQYLEIKRKHMDTIIVYQVGYKYRIFGEDARIAAKELSFFLIPGKFRYDEHPSEAQWDRFASCSFPTISLNTHVKRLVAAGHKVGVVKQLETAALKAVGDNRNTPFVRKLTNVYTKGTYVDDIEGAETAGPTPTTDTANTGYLLCLTEINARGYGNDEKVHVGIIAVQPATGSIIYDDFEDGFMRSEIETRLLHIAPCEYLIVGDVSDATDKLVRHLSGTRSNVFGDQARLERVNKSRTMGAESYSHISNFYASKLQPTGEAAADERQSHTLDRIHQLTEHVTICLSAMITHLTEYGLEHIFDLTKNFQSFSARTHMLLNGNTLSSLEIYRNQSDHSEKGSLFWSLDRTKTRFGKRLLRSWVGRPLLDKAALENRADAVEELLTSGSTLHTDRLHATINSVKGDLEKILTRIYYKKAARPEVLLFLQNLQQIANKFAHVKSVNDGGYKSTALNQLVYALPRIGDVIVDFLDKINAQAAKDDDKYNFFRAEFETEAITEHMVAIAAIEHDLDEHRAVAAQKLGRKKVEYVTILQTEYLIEVLNEKALLQKVPASWIKVNGTKKLSRFHTPEVVKMVRERDQHKEAMAAACNDAYTDFLGDISQHYQELRECIQSLATLDCLLSLAEVSSQPGYVKAEYCDYSCIEVTAGRHPMVEQLLLETYVPNDIRLGDQDSADDYEVPNAMLITGPNMGGKSSYVRSVALIAIMAQIGSYVPADSAKLGMLDAVFTRMGAFDNMMRGESTFMVELSETSDILKQATPRSLVILDELGRGTSTHDGVAIAEAVLREMVDRSIMTLFITHYQDLSRLGDELAGLKNVHMRFQEGEGGEITFLYEVGAGVAHRSYGLNVARLANVPKGVIDLAEVKSKELEVSLERRKLGNMCGMLSRVAVDSDEVALDRLLSGLEGL